jgi:hypothetical protein
MSNGSRLAACAAGLWLAACSPRETYVGGADASQVTDAAGDLRTDAARDAPSDAAARADAASDLGPPCVLGGTSADLPATIGCPQAAPLRITVSGDQVYWTVDGPGQIVLGAGLASGAGEPLVYDKGGAFGLVVDAGFIYYTQPTLGRIMRVPLSGGAPRVLVSALDSPKFLATDGASLYWTGGRLNNGSVMKLALTDGATPDVLIDGQSGPFAIAVAGGYVYWTDLGDGTIVRTPDHLLGPADAGVRTASRLATGLKGPTDLVLVGAYAYAPDQAGVIRRVPLDGGDLELVADAQGRPYGLATDGVSIYWTTSGEGGALFMAPLGANVAGRKIIGGQADPGCLTVTTTDLYWATQRGQPTIERLARPF